MAEQRKDSDRRAVARRKAPERERAEPTVTYSRVRSGQHDLHDDDAGPLYEAVEVPHVERPPPLADFDEFPRLSADDIDHGDHDEDDDFDPLEDDDEPRRRLFPLIVFGLGLVAVAIGAGVIYATVFSAGTPDATAVLPAAQSDDTPAAEASLETPVRSIPLTGNADPAGPSAAAPPPSADQPVVEGVTTTPPAPRPKPQREGGEQPTQTATTGGEPATAAAPATPAASGEGEDAFISRIESTLSRIQPAGDTTEPTAIPSVPTDGAGAGAPATASAPEPIPGLQGTQDAGGLDSIIEADEQLALPGDPDGEIMHAEGDIFADEVVPVDENGQPIGPVPNAGTVTQPRTTFETDGLVFQPGGDPIDLTGGQSAGLAPPPVAQPNTVVQPGQVFEFPAEPGTVGQPQFVPPADIPNVDTLSTVPLD